MPYSIMPNVKLYRTFYLILMLACLILVGCNVFGLFDDFNAWWVYLGVFIVFLLVQMVLIFGYARYIRAAQRRHFERYGNEEGNSNGAINTAFAELRDLPGMSRTRSNVDRRWELNNVAVDMSDPPPKY